MRNTVKRVRRKTIKTIWDDATATCEHNCSDLASSTEVCLTDHYEDYLRYKDRKDRLRNDMQNTLATIRQDDKKIPAAKKNFVSEFHVARLLAETGPLSDFKSQKELQNYLGMNLQEKQSGNYKGKTRISKKGRSLARKILSQIVLSLVKTDRLYGPAYHKKKDKTGKPGTLLMTNYMRLFLKSFLGIYRSKDEFNLMRLFIDQGAYNKIYKTA